MLQALSVSVLLMHGAAPKVLMPDWTRVEVSAELSTFYAAHLAQALRAKGFEVVTAAELGTLLGMERQRQLLGCSTDASSCFTEFGNALGCDGTVVVTLAKLDDTLQANLKVLSTRTGGVLAETSVEANSQKRLMSELVDAARVLARAFEEPVAVTSAPPPRRPWLIPAIGAAPFLVFGGIAQGVARADLGQLSTVGSYAAALELESHGRAFEVSSWASFGVAGACLVTALLLYLLGGT